MRMISGAIILHAGAVLTAAGGTSDDMAFVPMLLGGALMVWGGLTERPARSGS